MRKRSLGFKNTFIFRAMLLAGSACVPVSVHAQVANQAGPADMKTVQSYDEANGGIQDIIVTAQKREQSLQKTPIAIDVLNQQALEDRGIRSVSDFFSGAVPALRVAPIAGRPSALLVGMRGIVANDVTQMSRDPGVGIYVDGVVLGRVQGLGTELFEVERFEILKGPQGTLFGRNAVGGALNIISRKPSGEFGLRAKAGVRNYDGYNAEIHLDLPEISDLSLKLDGMYSKRGGTVRNGMAGQSDFNQYEKYGARLAARWRPSDNFTADFSIDIARDHSTPYYTQLQFLLPGAPPLAPLRGLEPRRAKQSAVPVVLQPSVGKSFGTALSLSYEVAEGLELRSISSYRQLEQTQYDNAGVNFTAYRPNGTFGRYSFSGVKQHQFSQEFQAVGTAERLNYVLGLFYFDEHGKESQSSPNTARFDATGTGFTLIPDPFVNPALPARAAFANATSKAIFGQATYTPAIAGDRLHLTLGGRYTWDSKDGQLTIVNGAIPVFQGVRAPVPFVFKSDRFDPAITLAADLTDNVHGYIKWSRAYRAGGANARSATFASFGPEVAATSEIGLKSDLFDRRVRINLAAYHTKYSNLQVEFLNPANLSAQETRNTDRPAKIKGFEAEITVQPTRSLTLSVNYAYTDAQVPDQFNPFAGTDVPVHIIRTPKNAVSASADYSVPLSFAALRFHVDASADDGSFTVPTNSFKTRSFAVLNGRVTLEEFKLGSGGSASIALWGRNLTNRQNAIYDFDAAGTGLINGRTIVYAEPRTYGIEASVKF
jgi:iron complex outermembrane receptor protein